jgi:hypothetical protein
MAEKIYKLGNGERVPSVTGVCAFVDGDPGGLLHWANKGGLAGKTLPEMRGAADVGTWAHAAIEYDFLDKEDMDIPAEANEEQRAQVANSLAAWRRWREQNAPERIAIEKALVSEAMKVGGTLDHVLRVGGRVGLLDVKTGAIYGKQIVQIAAYGMLWEENEGEKIEEYHLLGVGKDDGALHWHTWVADSPTIAAARRAFVLAREVYDIAAVLKKAVG